MFKLLSVAMQVVVLCLPGGAERNDLLLFPRGGELRGGKLLSGEFKVEQRNASILIVASKTLSNAAMLRSMSKNVDRQSKMQKMVK